MKTYVIKLILSTFLIIGIHADKSKDSKDSTGWTCESDGFWYQNGAKTDYSNCGGGNKDGSSSSNKDKKSEACTESTNPGMPSSFPKTCINGPPDQGLRCWWTYIPASVKKLDSSVKVPLVIDMHGGGGCASHQALSSGFRELADSLSGKDSFITVWPQGYGYQWGTCGSDCAAAQAKQASSGKTVHSVDDLTFLASMIAYIVKSDSSDNPSIYLKKTRVDPERVYSTGFSMGCMMSHRLAMEKSNIIAGFGGHGGTLIEGGNDLAGEKKKYNIKPMPAYMTGGTDDGWFDMAVNAFNHWATWNECGVVDPTINFNLTESKGEKGGSQPIEARLKVQSSCANNANVNRLEIINGKHVPDQRMAKLSYDFLKSYKRANAYDALGDLPILQSSGVTSFNVNIYMTFMVLIIGCFLNLKN